MCANDPVNGVDPLGLSWLSACFGFGRTGPEAEAFDKELSDQYWSGKMGDRAIGAAGAEAKLVVGVGEAALAGKVAVVSGGTMTPASAILLTDAASRTSGGITDYANLFTDESPVPNGDLVEEAFKAVAGPRVGPMARDIATAAGTAGAANRMFAQATKGPTLPGTQRSTTPPPLVSKPTSSSATAPVPSAAQEETVKLLHGTTARRGISLLKQGPDIAFVEPGGGAPAGGFSTARAEGPFPLGAPAQYAQGKARLFPSEGVPVVLEIEVPKSVVRKAIQVEGEVRFEPGYGLEELLKRWSSLVIRIKKAE
jgi:hypothetical protein